MDVCPTCSNFCTTTLQLPSLVVLYVKALLSATALQLAMPPVLPRFHLRIAVFYIAFYILGNNITFLPLAP